MIYRYLLSIGAACGLAVCCAHSAAAQTELPSRPDPANAPARAAAPAAAPYVAPGLPSLYPTNALGVEMGWGAPYGWGIEYARMVSSHVDINAGLGIGVGGKIGIGARYYFHPEERVSGYVGANLARSGRLDNVKVSYSNGSSTEEAEYSLNPSGVLHLRGGLRWQPGRVGLLGTVGYGVRFTGDPVVFNNTAFYGPPSQSMRNLVNIISPGGLELSIGVLFPLGGR